MVQSVSCTGTLFFFVLLFAFWSVCARSILLHSIAIYSLCVCVCSILLHSILNYSILQISHTLLSLIDSKTGQPFLSTQKRLTLFTKMLRSGIPQSLNWMSQIQPPLVSQHSSVEDSKSITGMLWILHNCFLVTAFVRKSAT